MSIINAAAIIELLNEMVLP